MAYLTPIYSLPNLYIDLQRVIVSSNTTLDIGQGQSRDSTNSIDMGVGGDFPSIEGNTVTAITLNAAVNGFNGLDTGSLAASTFYSVYVISDSSYKNPTGAILTLASNSQPLMPLYYDSMRLVGYVATDSSSHFLPGYLAGTGNLRVFKYDAPQATSVTAGNATTYTGVSLSALVPPVQNTIVSVAYAFTPGAASRVLNLTPYGATGDAVTLTGQVTSVVLSGNVDVMSRFNSGTSSISYKVSNSGDAVSLKVAGYSYFL